MTSIVQKTMCHRRLHANCRSSRRLNANSRSSRRRNANCIRTKWQSRRRHDHRSISHRWTMCLPQADSFQFRTSEIHLDKIKRMSLPWMCIPPRRCYTLLMCLCIVPLLSSGRFTDITTARSRTRRRQRSRVSNKVRIGCKPGTQLLAQFR